MKSKITSLMNRGKRDSNLIRLLIILAISFAVMAVLQPNIFLTKKYIVSMLFLFPEYGILALAMMLAMISGGIDLSVIATANFSGIIAIQFLQRFYTEGSSGAVTVLFLIAAVAIAVAVGACCGALISTFIGIIGIPPMLATLGG
ncbi:MAG: ABC transporter permease, partial [Oscillospiraceae bacterium]